MLSACISLPHSWPQCLQLSLSLSLLISKEAQRYVRLSISILPLTSKRGPETTLSIQYPQLSQTCLKQHCKHSLYRLFIIPYCMISLSLSLSSCASDVILVLLQYCVCLIEKEKGGNRSKCRCVRTTTSVYLSLSFFLSLSGCAWEYRWNWGL